MADIILDRLSRQGFRATETGARLLGADTLDAKLAELEASARTALLEEGLRAGAEVIRQSAAERAADHPELARAIAVQLTEESGVPAILIGPQRGRSRHGRLLVMLGYWREFGTTAHEIVVRALKKHSKSRRLRGQPMGTAKTLSSGTAFFGTRVQHPGAPAKPFLRPAFDEQGPEAVRVMGQTIWERLRALAAR